MMRPNPVTTDDERTLRRLLGEAGLAPWAGELVEVAEHGIALGTRPAGFDGPEPFSRCGGVPAVPPGFVWPGTESGPEAVPDCFVAQIDLTEVASADVNGLLPPRGLLYFFFPGDDGFRGRDPVSVLHFPDHTAADTAPYDVASDPAFADPEAGWGAPPWEFTGPPAPLYAAGKALLATVFRFHDEPLVDLPEEAMDRLFALPATALDVAPQHRASMVLLGPDRDPDQYVVPPHGRGPERVLLAAGRPDFTGCPLYYVIRDEDLAAADFGGVEAVTVQH
ncbi:DUF1963 domain-containing protein [Kitasatospora sp. NPDC050463]|uniref:DUF1963 domain-containing protein n=1 Tax=Kitasatospora sp. NPDC050463 TaxID=3155786 RepID=UPI0033C0EE28